MPVLPCVPNEVDEETEDPGDEGEQGDAGDEETEGPASSSPVDVNVPQESRSVYCSMNGLAHRANGEGMGISLNLRHAGRIDGRARACEIGEHYESIGASCDALPRFKDSGVWVDHVGDVTPGVAVYPLFVAA